MGKISYFNLVRNFPRGIFFAQFGEFSALCALSDLLLPFHASLIDET